MPQAAAAELQQQDGQVFTLGAQHAVALDDLHLAAVYQTGAAGGHPGFADHLGNLGAALNRGEDGGVELVYLPAQVIDLRHSLIVPVGPCQRKTVPAQR